MPSVHLNATRVAEVLNIANAASVSCSGKNYSVSITFNLWPIQFGFESIFFRRRGRCFLQSDSDVISYTHTNSSRDTITALITCAHTFFSILPMEMHSICKTASRLSLESFDKSTADKLWI